MVNLNTCDIKGCENVWSYRVNIIDLCEDHYKLWKLNLKQSKQSEQKVLT